MRRSALQTFVLLVLLLQTGLPAAENPTTGQTIAIVAGKSFPKDRLTLTELKAIYRGEMHLLKDLWIHPIDQRESRPIRQKFLERVVNMTHDRYIDHWNQWIFRNGGFTPLLKNNSAEVIETVRDQDGTVGYVWLEETQNEPGIKVLLILDNS